MAAVETIPQQYSREDIEGRLWDWELAALDGLPRRPESQAGVLTDRL